MGVSAGWTHNIHLALRMNHFCSNTTTGFERLDEICIDTSGSVLLHVLCSIMASLHLWVKKHNPSAIERWAIPTCGEWPLVSESGTFAENTSFSVTVRSKALLMWPVTMSSRPSNSPLVQSPLFRMQYWLIFCPWESSKNKRCVLQNCRSC